MAGITAPRPLSAADDRLSFDCGRASLNQWFHRHGWNNHHAGVSRVSVVCDTGTGKIAGYISLSAAQIEREHLPKQHQRNKPDPVPALLLGQLAVDTHYQERGIARSLVFYAFATAVRLAQQMGCFCIITQPLDDGVRDFYRHHGFEDLPFDPKRGMAVRIKDLKHNGFDDVPARESSS
jgi:predicted N-acetyltransferase YhbS